MERQLTSLLCVAGVAAAMTALGSMLPSLAVAVDVDTLDKGILVEIQSHYGLTEDEVIDRLASEMEAAEAAHYIEDLSLESYAGQLRGRTYISY